MKTIHFNALIALNFKIFRDFGIDFNSFAPGCHSIRGVNKVNPRLGSNGVGKSSIWDALCFALYGKTTKRLRAADVQPYGSQENPEVRLSLAVDGEHHIIVRRAVPHSLSLDGMSCTQERLDSLLGIDIDLFLQTVVLAQGLPMFLDLEPRSKLQLMSDVLHLNRFEVYSRLAQGEVDGIESEAVELRMAANKTAGQIDEAERQITALRVKAKSFSAAKRTEITRLGDEHDDARRAALEAEHLVTNARNAFDDLNKTWLGARDRLKQSEIARVGAQKLRKSLDMLQPGIECPTCGVPVTEHTRERITAHADQLLKRSNYDNQLAAVTELERQIHAARATHNIAVAAQREAERAMDQAKHALVAARVKDNPFAVQITELEDRLLNLDTAAIKTNEAIIFNETERARIAPWVSGFKDIRLIVLDNTLRALSLLATGYANELGLVCDVQFSIDRTTKAGTSVAGIHMTVDAVEKLEAWSGGEAQRLRLAASLALSATLLAEAGINVNLLALDEPSAHLSPEGLDELTGFLVTHAEAEGRTVFITDQRPVKVDSSVMLERNADNVILHR